MHSRQDPGVNALDGKGNVSVSVPTEVRESLRKTSKLKRRYTIVSVCPAPNILFSSAAFCAAFATFLAFLISSFLITATVALALGVPTSYIQGSRGQVPGRVQSLLDSVQDLMSSKPCIL